MIPLHRLTHPGSPLYLNPDLIQTIEATPDTVVALTNGSRFVVNEAPVEVLAMIRDWRAGILAKALERHDGPAPSGLTQVVHLSGRAEPPAQDL